MRSESPISQREVTLRVDQRDRLLAPALVAYSLHEIDREG